MIKSSVVLTAFLDELEKIAITRPLMITEPGMYVNAKLPGLSISNKEVWKQNPSLAKLRNIPKEGSGVIFMAPKEEFAQIHGPQHGEAAHKITRRHEMTHWLRGQRGEQMGKPGIRGVLKTLRGELAGHVSPMRSVGPVYAKQLAQALPQGVLGSTRHAYQRFGGIRGALMGGTFGKLLKRLAFRK